jgi:hypothetical protein
MAKLTSEILECLKGVSNELDADIYVISGALYEPLDDNALDNITKVVEKKKNALLVLTTFGGSPEVAYRIARGFHRAYGNDGEFFLLISGPCKSAGTLLAIGATKLIMTDNAQLGPLDVQFDKPDALGEIMSGLTPCQSLEFLREKAFECFEYCLLELQGRSKLQITTRTASDIAAKLATGLFDPVYAHLDPMQLGEYHRNMMIALEYGKRLNRGNMMSDEALRQLTHGYPSHGFIIDREEASGLFKNVEEPTAEQLKMLAMIWPLIQKDFVHQDASSKKYIGVSRRLNPDIDLTQEDASKKEVRTDERESKQEPEPAVAAAEGGSEPKGNSNVGTSPSQPQDSGAVEGRAEDTRQDSEVIEQIEKAEENE